MVSPFKHPRKYILYNDGKSIQTLKITSTLYKLFKISSPFEIHSAFFFFFFITYVCLFVGFCLLLLWRFINSFRFFYFQRRTHGILQMKRRTSVPAICWNTKCPSSKMRCWWNPSGVKVGIRTSGKNYVYVGRDLWLLLVF